MAKFVIKEGKGGKHFNYVSDEGKIVGSSEVYKSDSSCLGGIESVKRSSEGGIDDLTMEGGEAVKHPKFELYQDKAGEYRFRLKARNGEIVLASNPFGEKADCLSQIEALKKAAPAAETVEE